MDGATLVMLIEMENDVEGEELQTLKKYYQKKTNERRRLLKMARAGKETNI